jgi:hypothetical protein
MYREERRRPGYVLENGKSSANSNPESAARLEVKPPSSDKRKAA